MAKTINEVNELKKYLVGVLTRADHHAEMVKKIALFLVGMIIAYKDDDQPIKVMQRNGVIGTVLWVYIKGTRYAFVYNHDTMKIDIKRNTQRGEVVTSIDNNANRNDLIRLFETL